LAILASDGFTIGRTILPVDPIFMPDVNAPAGSNNAAAALCRLSNGLGPMLIGQISKKLNMMCF
jgi:hypothetical protein